MTLSDGDHGSPVGPVPVGDLQPAEAAGHPALGRHGPPRPQLHLSAAALHTRLTIVTGLFLDQGNFYLWNSIASRGLTGLTSTFNVGWEVSMSAKSVCVILGSSLNVMVAYFCVDSGSGNVTDIE